MAKSLIIVESPAKTKTLKNFLGPGYMVEASMGHVRDLPEREIGVNVESGFVPKYVPIKDRKDVLKKLSEAAKKADTVYLASDPDREGEAIAWHLAEALNLKDAKRIEYNEITRTAVEHALQNPRSIDYERVEAQETRRILDRLVGYRLSPLLWKKVAKNTSAGRVQSVVLRLIVDREREIQDFVPEEYWSLTATLTPQPPKPKFPFDAKFIGRGKEKIALRVQEDADRILRELEGARYTVSTVTKREKKRNPAAPFITSTLQQESARKLGFGNRKTMSVAQALYEGIELGDQGAVGLITYMRTDSTRIAGEAQQEARKYISEVYGGPYLPENPKQYASKGGAQDAHEAIRPTSVYRTPDSVAKHLSPEQLKLYRLIWQRFVASQMNPAVFDVTTADIDANGYTFRATGSVQKFDGFMRVYTEGKDTEEQEDEEKAPLPPLEKDQPLDLLALTPKQHFTEPPPRYTEATLVKAMSDTGIGRPSTYASFIATLLDREYAKLEEKKFRPTELGMTVCDLLVKHFPTIMDIRFTAGMETKLDDVEEGEADKVAVLRDFYDPFNEAIAVAHETMERIKPEQVESDVTCPNCGKIMMIRQSKLGPFLGCSGYPKCKTILNVDGTPVEKPEKAQPIVTDQKCPKCGKPLVEREGRYGKFLGCSGYPRCKTIVRLEGDSGPARRNGDDSAAAESTGVNCPKDGGEILVKRSRRGAIFYGCSNYPSCDFTTWHKPLDRICPRCNQYPLGVESFRGRETGKIKCTDPDCGYEETAGAELAGINAS